MSSAQHRTQPDGTVQVTYDIDGEIFVEEYGSQRSASIEATLILFPGTSRDFLERMHH